MLRAGIELTGARLGSLAQMLALGGQEPATILVPRLLVLSGIVIALAVGVVASMLVREHRVFWALAAMGCVAIPIASP